MRFGYLVVLAWTFVAPAVVLGQAGRYELGRRVRSFENAYATHRDAADRQRAVPHVNEVVKKFFSFDFPGAARAMDEARWAIAGENAPPADVRWADSLAIEAQQRLLDVNANEVTLAVSTYYPSNLAIPEGAACRMQLRDANAKEIGEAETTPIRELPVTVRLPLANVKEGDYRLRIEILAGDKPLLLNAQGISLVERLSERLEAVAGAVKAWQGQPQTSEHETAKALLRTLRALAKHEVQETSYPAAKLLSQVEAILANKSVFGHKQPGQFWLRLALEKDSIPVRIMAPPQAAQGKPLPLVIALHGAGGSENIYFEAYGNGATVQQCQDRGWLLVGPRSGFFSDMPAAQIVDAVDRLYPVDRKRVYIVGHSMGAMQAVRAARNNPDRWAGIAALGGGGHVTADAAIRDIPFFIGVGSEDFAMPSVKSLREQLTRAEVKTLIFREYPHVEHLAIVQECLPDVFRFFDEQK
jgi:predicted esterase